MSGDEKLWHEVFEGWFWMRGDERRAYGRLEHDLREGPRLHLVGGEFVDYRAGGPVPIWNVSAIHGEALDGQRLSVLEFWTSGWSAQLTLSESTVVDGIADRIVVGQHVDGPEDVTANHFVCSLFGLREFLVGTLHQRGPLDIPAGDEEHSRPLSVDLGDGVSLMFTARRQRGGSFVDFRSHVGVTAQFNTWPARSLPEMEREFVQPLQDLIVFATRRQSWVTSLTAWPEMGPGSVTSLSAADPPPDETRELETIALNLREHEDPAAVIRAGTTCGAASGRSGRRSSRLWAARRARRRMSSSRWSLSPRATTEPSTVIARHYRRTNTTAQLD